MKKEVLLYNFLYKSYFRISVIAVILHTLQLSLYRTLIPQHFDLTLFISS